MKKAVSIALIGETCSGKSTLGKGLSAQLHCTYISFGDLKRKHIHSNTPTSKRLQVFLKAGLPIPADLGYSVIEHAVGEGLNIVSGYPITTTELATLSAHAPVIGVVVLDTSDEVILQRFYERRVCPLCDLPGVIGDDCPTHGIAMVERQDLSYEQLIARRKLYRERIRPFLETKEMQQLSRLSIHTDTMTPDAVQDRASLWLKTILTEQENVHDPDHYPAHLAS